jgi:predicted ATP-grasp superfamily ATP-dependent carboligase
VPSRPRVLLIGTSTRAMAQAAVRAGFLVTTADAYADADQPAAARCLSMPMGVRWTAHRVARLASHEPVDALVYGSPFENEPEALARVSHTRALWGNAPAVLRRVRDPRAVADACRAGGFSAPAVIVPGDAGHLAGATPDGAWMLKPLRSGGGRRVHRWRGGLVPSASYLQARVEGQPGSVAFVAAAGQARVLGVSRQLVGDPAFGARGFQYCGSVLLGAHDAEGEAWREQATGIARVVARAFGLTGVGGVDFIAGDGLVHPIEVNPRWTASMELVERGCDVSVFGAHAAACTEHALPLHDVPMPAHAVGKAVVFARHAAIAGDTARWLEDDTIRDVPRAGTMVHGGDPVCTVFATAPDAGACYTALVERANDVYRALAAWRRVAA